jgi:hypothetical protein
MTKPSEKEKYDKNIDSHEDVYHLTSPNNGKKKKEKVVKYGQDKIGKEGT